MHRPLLVTLVAALLALGLLAGCGGDDDDGGGGDEAAEVKKEFEEGYRPINDEFLAIGGEVAETIQAAKGKTNAELTRAFGDLAADVRDLRARLDALRPPPEYEADTARVSKAMEVVGEDLREISVAAATGNASEARTQVQQLIRHSVEVRTARRALARKTGAKV